MDQSSTILKELDILIGIFDKVGAECKLILSPRNKRKTTCCDLTAGLTQELTSLLLARMDSLRRDHSEHICEQMMRNAATMDDDGNLVEFAAPRIFKRKV